MDQIFNIRRWWSLVAMHWAENRRRYVLSLLAMAGLLTAWYCFALAMDKGNPLATGVQFGTFNMGLYFVGSLYASMLFADLGSKKKAIQFLSIPASHLEKMLCALFFGVLLFFIAYTAVFYIVDIPMVHLSENMMKQQTWTLGDNGNNHGVFNIFTRNGAPEYQDPEPYFLLIYFPVQAAFILGSVYFRRYAFLGTIVSVLLLALLLFLFQFKILEPNVPHGWYHRGFFSWAEDRSRGGNWKYVENPAWFSTSMPWLLKYTPPLILWAIAYVRLKEKEV